MAGAVDEPPDTELVALHAEPRNKTNTRCARFGSILPCHPHQIAIKIPQMNATSDVHPAILRYSPLTLVTNMRPFQIMRALKTIMARLRHWKRSWRLFAQSFFSSRTCLSITSLSIL